MWGACGFSLSPEPSTHPNFKIYFLKLKITFFHITYLDQGLPSPNFSPPQTHRLHTFSLFRKWSLLRCSLLSKPDLPWGMQSGRSAYLGHMVTRFGSQMPVSQNYHQESLFGRFSRAYSWRYFKVFLFFSPLSHWHILPSPWLSFVHSFIITYFFYTMH